MLSGLGDVLTGGLVSHASLLARDGDRSKLLIAHLYGFLCSFSVLEQSAAEYLYSM